MRDGNSKKSKVFMISFIFFYIEMANGDELSPVFGCQIYVATVDIVC